MSRPGGPPYADFFIPPGALGVSATAVLLAVLAEPFPSHDSIQKRTEFSRSTINRCLHRLRAEGLVTFTEGRSGTIRAAVTVVAAG